MNCRDGKGILWDSRESFFAQSFSIGQFQLFHNVDQELPLTNQKRNSHNFSYWKIESSPFSNSLSNSCLDCYIWSQVSVNISSRVIKLRQKSCKFH